MMTRKASPMDERFHFDSDRWINARLRSSGREKLIVNQEGNPMLVLSRQRDESIIIGDNIIVTVVDIRGDKVRLGINAPTEISVHRQEVYEAIQREGIRSRQSPPPP